MEGRVPVLQWYFDESVSEPLRWTQREADENFRLAEARGRRYYGETDAFLYEALARYPVRGKRVLVVGSANPWYECICLHHGAEVQTLEYRPVDSEIPELTVQTPEEFAARPARFDAIVSISSIEHDGLGRYGDPIDPDGDLRAMTRFRGLLEPGGLLLLAVPMGRDALVWNAHRIYGPLRWPRLIEGWEVVDSFGFEERLYDAELGACHVQPVWVLRSRAHWVRPALRPRR